MASTPKEAQRFMDDLERAKALSLETMELDRLRREHFRNQRDFEDLARNLDGNHASAQSKSHLCKNEARNGSTDVITTNIEPRSRPKADISRTQHNVVLPPPPSSRKLESSLGSVTASECSVTTKDLMSFHGKAESDKKLSVNVHLSTNSSFASFFLDNSPIETPVQAFSQPQVNSRTPPTPGTMLPQHMPMSTPFPMYPLFGNMSALIHPCLTGPLPLNQWNFPPPRFQPADTSLIASHSVPIPPRCSFIRPIVPHLPPSLHQTRTFSAAQPQTKPEDPLSVLRSVSKRPNSNLIDLSVFDDSGLEKLNLTHGYGPSTYGQNELLKNFDPLLTNIKEDIEREDLDIKQDIVVRKDTLAFPSSAEVHNEEPNVALRVAQTAQPTVRSSTRSDLRKERSFRAEKSGKRGIVKWRGNPAINAFRDSVVRLRKEFPYEDDVTNLGCVISPVLESLREESMSMRLTIATDLQERPIAFTCDVNTSIEHIINNVVFTILDDNTVNPEEYILKVHGLEEYLTNNTVLADYEYVHHCQKFAEDVRLSLRHINKLRKPLLRTAEDDKIAMNMDAKILYPPSSVTVNQDSLNILMETLDREILRTMEKAAKATGDIIKPVGVVQAVKAISSATCQVETKELKSALGKLTSLATKNYSDCSTNSISSEPPSLTPKSCERKVSELKNALEKVKSCVHSQLRLIRSTFNVDIELPDVQSSPCKTMTEITQHADTVLVHVASIYRLVPYIAEYYDSFTVKCELYHGIRLLTETVETGKPVTRTTHFYDHLVFDELVEIGSMQIRHLPRETRLCCSLYGVRFTSADGKESGQPTKNLLAWGAIQLFNFEGMFAQGKYLCGMWPDELDIRLGPALCNMKTDCPVLEIEIPMLNSTVIFPPLPAVLPSYGSRFEDLDTEQQQQIFDIIERSSSSTSVMADRKTLWESRHFLYNIPQALPKVLLGAIDWDYECLSDVYSMLHKWKPMNRMDALELLLPCFPDVEVRKMAVSWIRGMGPDELCDYLPQLVQAFKYETYEESAIAKLLLERSLTNIRVAHNLYWLLRQIIDDEMYGQRIHLLLNALLACVGKALHERLKFQETLMDELSEIAKKVKTAKDKQKTLTMSLENIHYLLCETPTSLPLTPSFEVAGIAKDCSFFNSNTIPLKLAFKSLEVGASPLEAIYKEGDDLQQDMLTLQMIRIMDKLWLKEGLDLRIVTFKCVPTGPKKGILELVKGSETLRKIHVEHGGLTGSFREDSIAEWLQRHNPSELEYQQAVENFTYSCAGYVVATYILGICDRHNDNIMLKTSGHMFHIDFAKFLGDVQTFGSIKRDRVPFVFTSDMAYVINGGDKPSSKFHNFVDLCCQAFNVIRKNGNLFLNLFLLMVSSGIPGVTVEAVNYVQTALLSEVTDSEAEIAFSRMIDESLKNSFTQINFFVHNIAQWKLNSEESSTMLSFIPKTFTLEADGKINNISVVRVEKRYEPAKHYVYILKVVREGHADPTLLIRTYREFCEFHQKLCKLFPHAKYLSLPGSVPFKRSNIRQVAEKRKAEIEMLLVKLSQMADEIKHCDLVYTFFHPVLRDQQEGIFIQNDFGVSNRRYTQNRLQGVSYGQVQLSIFYKNNTLFIMVRHAKDLSSVKGTTPDPYVKTYLLPDAAKTSKQKTKVVRKSCHPTFMELLVYNKPLEFVKARILQVSVWDCGRMAENSFLGEVRIRLSNLDLNTDTLAWYQLSCDQD